MSNLLGNESPKPYRSQERARTSCGFRPSALARGIGRSAFYGYFGGRQPGAITGWSRQATQPGATMKGKQGQNRPIATTATKRRLPSQLKREHQAIPPKPSIKGRLYMAKETEAGISAGCEMAFRRARRAILCREQWLEEALKFCTYTFRDDVGIGKTHCL